MNATKRKFNALLQGLNSPRTTSSDSRSDKMNTPSRTATAAISNDAILQKRRRLGFPESTAPTLFSTPQTTTSLSNVVLRRSGTQSSSKPASNAPARYCPGDRNELLKRLATFQEITDWTPKPDKINEIEWAKRGWICQGKEKVRCVLCHKELIVKLDRKESNADDAETLASSEIADALVNKYFDLIITSHQQDCLWRKRGCDETLLRLSFSNTLNTFSALRQRYDELCTREPFLPYEFNLRLPDDVNMDKILSQLPPDFFTKPAPAADKSGNIPAAKSPNRAALVLALLGWQGLTNARIGSVPNSASCHTCLRRLGLWMFKSKEVDEEGRIIVPAPMDHLDPLREHRFFCPWKSAQAQSRGPATAEADSDMNAGKILTQAIRNESELRSLYSGTSKRLGQTENGGLSSTSGPAQVQPFTPGRNTSTNDASVATPQTPQTDAGEDDDEAARAEKDKERWARLRKVKSLFDTKGSRRLRRGVNSPGTASLDKFTGK